MRKINWTTVLLDRIDCPLNFTDCISRDASLSEVVAYNTIFDNSSCKALTSANRSNNIFQVFLGKL